MLGLNLIHISERVPKWEHRYAFYWLDYLENKQVEDFWAQKIIHLSIVASIRSQGPISNLDDHRNIQYSLYTLSMLPVKHDPLLWKYINIPVCDCCKALCALGEQGWTYCLYWLNGNDWYWKLILYSLQDITVLWSLEAINRDHSGYGLGQWDEGSGSVT